MPTDEKPLIDERMYVWIVSSIREAIKARWLETLSKDVPHYFEADPRETGKTDTRLEVRIDVPTYTKITNGQFNIEVIIGLGIYTQDQGTDLFAHQKITSSAASILLKDITVLEQGYGELNDTGNFVGCLQLEESVKIEELGQVDPTLTLQQATCTAAYKLYN